MTKYSSKPKTVDNIRFDSQKEAKRYSELKLFLKIGIIENLKIQPSYELQEAFKKNGMYFPAIRYKADFEYKEIQTGKIFIEDVKGFQTKDFKIKRKMFEYKYPDLEIRLI